MYYPCVYGVACVWHRHAIAHLWQSEVCEVTSLLLPLPGLGGIKLGLRWPPMSSFSKHFLSTHYVPDTMLVLLAHTDTMFNSLQAGEQKTKPAIRAAMEASLKCRGHSHRAALNQNGSGRASHRRWCVRWGHDTVPVTTIKKHTEFHSQSMPSLSDGALKTTSAKGYNPWARCIGLQTQLPIKDEWTSGEEANGAVEKITFQ